MDCNFRPGGLGHRQSGFITNPMPDIEISFIFSNLSFGMTAAAMLIDISNNLWTDLEET
jgi:hypothetical protein